MTDILNDVGAIADETDVESNVGLEEVGLTEYLSETHEGVERRDARRERDPWVIDSERG